MLPERGREMAAIAEIRDEIGEIIAMMCAIQRPGEKLTALQAIGRYSHARLHDDAAQLAVLCARGDPDLTNDAEL
jgi:hypothetical protein